MIILVLERSPEPSGYLGLAVERIRNDRGLNHDNSYHYSTTLDEGCLGYKIDNVTSIISQYNIAIADSAPKSKQTAIVTTHDPIIVDIFNFELLKNPRLNLEAFEVISANKGKPPHLKPILKDGQIDTSVLLEAREKFLKKVQKYKTVRKLKTKK